MDSNELLARDEMVRAVVGTYYAAAANAGLTARTRAQNSFTVIGFLGTILVTLLGTSISDLPLAVLIILMVSSLLWAVASILFTIAIGASSPKTSDQSKPHSVDDLVEFVLDEARIDRDRVDRWRFWGVLSAGAALITGLAAALVAADVTGPDKPPSYEVKLDQSQSVRLTEDCASAPKVVVGTVDDVSTDDTRVLNVNTPTCAADFSLVISAEQWTSDVVGVTSR